MVAAVGIDHRRQCRVPCLRLGQCRHIPSHTRSLTRSRSRTRNPIRSQGRTLTRDPGHTQAQCRRLHRHRHRHRTRMTGITLGRQRR